LHLKSHLHPKSQCKGESACNASLEMPLLELWYRLREDAGHFDPPIMLLERYLEFIEDLSSPEQWRQFVWFEDYRDRDIESVILMPLFDMDVHATRNEFSRSRNAIGYDDFRIH